MLVWKVSFVFFITSINLFSYSLKISNKWHLISALEDFEIEKSISGDCSFYKYQNNKWAIYESGKRKDFVKINKADGFYVYSSSACSLSYGE